VTPPKTASTPSKTPSVLFVCVKNGGKSQMAAGLMRRAAGNSVIVDSDGTRAGDAINGLSAQVLLEVGVDITDQTPQQLTDALIAAVDRGHRPRPGSAGPARRRHSN
jgi:arsenate-mycothiol transferase